MAGGDAEPPHTAVLLGAKRHGAALRIEPQFQTDGILNISKHSISFPKEKNTVFYKSPERCFWIKPCTPRLVGASLPYL